METVCETYQWQGISDETRIPHSMQRHGTALIPPIDRSVLDKVETAAMGLLTELAAALGSPTQPSGQASGSKTEAAGQHGKTKRKGVGPRRSSEELFKAALRKHHSYESGGSVLNVAPISTRGIETLMDWGISDTTAGRLLKKHFGGVEKYQEACFSGAIKSKLVVLLGDGLHAFGTFDPTEHDSKGSADTDGE